MADDRTLTPALPQDVAEALAFALRFDGRKRVHQADDLMARIAAERLVEHLALSGFVISNGGRVLESPTIEFGEDPDSLLVENPLAGVFQHQRQKSGEAGQTSTV